MQMIQSLNSLEDRGVGNLKAVMGVVAMSSENSARYLGDQRESAG